MEDENPCRIGIVQMDYNHFWNDKPVSFLTSIAGLLDISSDSGYPLKLKVLVQFGISEGLPAFPCFFSFKFFF